MPHNTDYFANCYFKRSNLAENNLKKGFSQKRQSGAFSSSVKKRNKRINEGKINNPSVNFIL